MITNELIIFIVSITIFIGGFPTKRFGLASLCAMGVLVANICIANDNSAFPYGCLMNICTFVVMLILHGKTKGKNSILYQHSPYNPNSRLPQRIKLLLLILASFVALIALISLMQYK